MGRHGYCDEIEDNWRYIRYRGAVTSALKGKRGQAFLRELIAALDAMPKKELVEGILQTTEGDYCALGCVGAARGIDMKDLDTYDAEAIAKALGISETLVREIEYINDEHVYATVQEEDAKRWQVVRDWAESELIKAN